MYDPLQHTISFTHMAGGHSRVCLRAEVGLMDGINLRVTDVHGKLLYATDNDNISDPAPVVRGILGLVNSLHTRFDIIVVDPYAEDWRHFDAYLRGQAGVTLGDLLPRA